MNTLLGGWLGEVASQGALEATCSQNLIPPLLLRAGSGNLQRDGRRVVPEQGIWHMQEKGQAPGHPHRLVLKP